MEPPRMEQCWIVRCCAVGIALAVVLGLGGCAAVRVGIERPERVEERELLPVLAEPGESADAAQWLEFARSASLPPEEELAALLEAGKRSFDGAKAGQDEARVIYDAVITRLFALMERHDFDLQPSAKWSRFRDLDVARTGSELLDPRAPEFLLPAAQIQIRGLQQRTTQTGLGVPFCAWFPENSPFLDGEPGVAPSGLALPATAVLTFSQTNRGQTARMEWIRTFQRDWVEIGGRRFPLAADFSAPLAVWVSRGRNRSLDVAALLQTDRHLDTAGLYQFQPFEPDKQPVVLVHGLMSRPETWLQAVNTLLGDPEIRSKYQFWFFLYPTGLPVWATAAGLRSELDRFNEELTPRLKQAPSRAPLNRKVLVGHSMGGLVCSLLVRDGGPYLWNQFFDTDLKKLPVSKNTREMIRRMVFFQARKDVERVVFVATPHRGSPLALRQLPGLAAWLIRLPFPEIQGERTVLLPFLRAEKRDHFRAPANSLRFLRSNSPLLQSILKLPRNPSIPMHSIIGDRGRSDAPLGSDGIVPFWSATLEGVESETIVPSNHGANDHPDGIRALGDILLGRESSETSISP